MKNVPAEIPDHATAVRLTDFLGTMKVALEKWEAARLNERAPVLDLGQAVQDNFMALKNDVEEDLHILKKRLAKFAGSNSIRGEYGTLASPADGAPEIAITDPSKIPRAFLCLDVEKVKRAVKAGVTNIEGVKIDIPKTVRLRA